MNKRPLMFVIMAFVLGEVLGQFTEYVVIFIALTGMTIGIACGRYACKKKGVPFSSATFLLIIVMLLGIIGGRLTNREDTLYHYFDTQIEANAYGRVYEINQLANGSEAYIEISEIEIGDFVYYNKYKARISNIEKYNLKIGNKVAISGLLVKFRTEENPGGFNSKKYYYGKGIDYDFYLEELMVTDNSYNFFYEFLRTVNHKISLVYYEILEEKEASVLCAMILGDKSGINKDLRELYNTAGIAHIIAISGLHISLIGITIYQLLRKKGVSYYTAGAISIILIMVYGVFTGLSISTLRALIMLSLTIIGSTIISLHQEYLCQQK